MPFLNQRKGENDRRKHFMINLHERMLPTSAGVEPATSWSPVGWRIQLSHQGRLCGHGILKTYVRATNKTKLAENCWSDLQNFDSSGVFMYMRIALSAHSFYNLFTMVSDILQWRSTLSDINVLGLCRSKYAYDPKRNVCAA